MMTRAVSILMALLFWAALLFVPDGKILPDVQNAYYIGERPETVFAPQSYGEMLAAGALCALLISAVLLCRQKKRLDDYLERLVYQSEYSSF